MQNSHPGARTCRLGYCCDSRPKTSVFLLNVYEIRIRGAVKYVQVSTNFMGKLLPVKIKVKEKGICILKVRLQL